MFNRLDNKRQPSIRRFKSPWFLNILTIVCAGIIFAAVGTIFFFAESMSHYHSGLIQTIHRIELQTTLAHLWFEEAIGGDPSIQIEDINAYMTKSEQAVDSILNGDLSSTTDSPENYELTANIIEMKRLLAELRQITGQRWKSVSESGAGSEIDQTYDAVFGQFFQQTDAIHASLSRKIAADSTFFRHTVNILIGISFLTIVTSALLANLYLAHQNKAKHQLAAINQQLRANEQQLRAANQQLRATEAELQSLAKFPAENPHPVLRILADRTVIYHNDASGPLLAHWDCAEGGKLPEPWQKIVQQALAEKKLVESVIECDGKSYSLSFAPVQTNNYVNIYAMDITARLQAENILLEKDAILRKTSQLGKMGGWEFYPRTGEVTWTDEVAQIHDLDPIEKTNVESALTYYAESSREILEAAIKEVIEQGTPYDLELEIMTAKANHKWVRAMGEAVFENGECVKVRGMIQDITAQKQSEQQLRAANQQLTASEQQLKAADQQLRAANQQLRASESQLRASNEQLQNANQKLLESEEHFRLLMEQSPSVIEIYDLSGLQVAVNKAYEGLWGFPAEHTLNRFNVLESQEVKRKGLLPYLQRAYAGETVTLPEYEFDSTGDTEGRGLGRKRWLHTRIYPIKDKNSNVENIVITHEDITDRKTNEIKYHALFENMMNGFALHQIVLDPDGNPVDYVFLEVNAAFERLLHLNRGDIIGKPISQALPAIKDDSGDWILRYGQVALGGGEIQFEQYSEGLGKWFSILAFSPAYGQFATIFEDITERRLAENVIQENEKRFRLIYEQLPLGYQSLNEEGRLIEVNPKWLSIMGYTKEEVLGRPFRDFLPERYRPLQGRRFEEFKAAGEIRSVDFELIRKDGSMVEVEIDGEIGRNPDGSFKQTHCILNDVTDRNKAQQEREKLVRILRAKNEELQSIVYVASHDLKSPLVNISGFGKLLAKHCDQLRYGIKDKLIDEPLQKLIEEEISEEVEFILQSADKMNALINGLLEVSRAGTVSLNISRLDMNQLISGIIKNVTFKAQEAGADITVDSLAPCLGDSTQLNRVFTNLIENALKYADPSRKPRIHISCTVNNGESVYCVEDNGIGVDPAYYDKIFEIFHRLNPQDKIDGEGLGLTIVRRILDRHNGKIWLESTPGKGSKFFVSLSNKEAL